MTIAKYANLFSNSVTTLWTNSSIDSAIEQNKRRFSEQEVNLILQQFPNRYDVEHVKIKEYIPSSYEPTDEVILLADDNDKILLNFQHINLNKDKVFTSNNEEAKVLYFTSLNNKYNHDLIENYFATTYHQEKISAVIFNTENNRDVIIGLDLVPNRFEIYNGEKIFIGGSKDDIFILNNRQFKINEIKIFMQKEEMILLLLIPYLFKRN